MNLADQKRATGVVDALLPAVVPYWSAEAVEDTDVEYRAGEMGCVLEAILYTADREGIQLPADLVQSAGECLAIPNMAPPGTDFAALAAIVDRQIASALRGRTQPPHP